MNPRSSRSLWRGRDAGPGWRKVAHNSETLLSPALAVGQCWVIGSEPSNRTDFATDSHDSMQQVTQETTMSAPLPSTA